MAIKRSELFSSIWSSCDALRGGMDASQYKDYVLSLLFVKFVSDKSTGSPFDAIQVPEGGSFADMVAAKNKKDIGDRINKIIGALAKANNLSGVIDQADFNDPAKLGDGDEMVERLTNLVAVFEDPRLNFSRNRATDDDILGDAYEYLMRNFATQSGKSKGQFYTPTEVSRIMAKLIGIGSATAAHQTIYDPTCGSGSLLLRAAAEAQTGISLYGQEKDQATAAIARMNLVIHGQPSAEIWQDNTLSRPHWKNEQGGLKTFDFAVANPPFSDKAWMTGIDPVNDPYDRFSYGVPPAKNGDYAFLLHVLASLNSTGRGAIILPHGVLFRGNAEADIRRALINQRVIEGIIGLPANLFFGTGIPACIVVLNKNDASSRAGIFMIDASKGFMKDGNKNRLRHQDIHRIVDAFQNKRDVPGYARLVPLTEIEGNDHNLNIPRYIDSGEPEDLHDIDAHLRGGMPNRDIDALAKYWHAFPGLRETLFLPADRPGYSVLAVEPSEIGATIRAHPTVTEYDASMRRTFDSWKSSAEPSLRNINVGDHPNDLINTIAEAILSQFGADPLVDKYDVYQRLMRYWIEVMQDDVYMLVVDGWKSAAEPLALDSKAKDADLTVGRSKYRTELVPVDVLTRRYFAAEADAIQSLREQIESIEALITEIDEEHAGEDALLADARTEAGKLSKTSATKRHKALTKAKDPDDADELAILSRLLALFDDKDTAGRSLKTAEADLASKQLARYQSLTEAETITLVVDDKWLDTMKAEIEAELTSVSHAFAARVRQLAERYAEPLPSLQQREAELRAKVATHLQRMDFSW